MGDAERVVVAITGSPTSEGLIRRAARIADRSRAELFGVHVARSDGLVAAGPSEQLGNHRQLLADLGGKYHELVADDPATALVEFARSVNATQLVLGTSQRNRMHALMRGSIITDAIRASPDIDVHVVAHRADPTDERMSTGSLRRPVRRVPTRRRIEAFALAIVGPIALTAAFVPFREDDGLEGVLPAYMLLVVATALLGGTLPALTAAVLGFALGNLFLSPPYHTLRITDLSGVVALAPFLTVAVVVAVLVGRLARRSADAQRARAQAQALASAAATVAEDDAVPELLDRLRSVLHADTVAVVVAGTPLAIAGNTELVQAGTDNEIDLGEGRKLVTVPAVTAPDDVSIVRAFGDQLVAAMRRNELASAEHEAQSLADVDRFRTALLRSVSHDLRTPLASIKAAASSLAQDDVAWPDDARDDFVETILEEGDRLDRIISNLLDASRLEAGVLSVSIHPVHLDDVVASATLGLVDAGDLRIDIDVDTPLVAADAGLLERVLENVIANAIRHGEGVADIDTVVDSADGIVSLRAIDHGVGIPPASRPGMFNEFQRLGDNGAGVGLGLSVAQGLVEVMGGSIEPSDTPGGGLTMAIVLPIAEDNA